jgi:hypothetical protein
VREQAKLEKDTGQALFLGLSLTDTLRAALRLGHTRAAAALRKAFAVPDTRWYWCKLISLAEAHDWEALEEWAGERKTSPIGWEPFLDKARQYGAPREYLARYKGGGKLGGVRERGEGRGEGNKRGFERASPSLRGEFEVAVHWF